jgi:hypothetical protein
MLTATVVETPADWLLHRFDALNIRCADDAIYQEVGCGRPMFQLIAAYHFYTESGERRYSWAGSARWPEPFAEADLDGDEPWWEE